MGAGPDAGPFGGLTAEAAAARIRLRNPALRAVIREVPAAEPADGPLRGVPCVLKDVWDTAGIPTTGGSARFAGRVPGTSSAVHRAIEAAGAVLLGKSNLSDHALVPESESPVGGRTGHPLDPARTPGGSSGGGAAAVADGMAAFDWGSDFGGSIRLPAAFCGVAGVRLSASRWPPVDHFPRIPLRLRLNGMGPLARSVAGCREVIRALAPALRAGSAAPFRASRVVVYGPDGYAAGQWATFAEEAGAALRRAGAEVGEAAVPAPREVDAAFTAALAACIGSFFEGQGAAAAVATALGLLPVARRLPLALHPASARVVAALAAARALGWPRGDPARLVEAVRRHWERGEILASPTTTHPAPRHGEVLRTRGIAAFVKLGNLCDATCVAVPFGTFADGFPRSLQLIGPPGSEEALLELAERLERDHAAA